MLTHLYVAVQNRADEPQGFRDCVYLRILYEHLHIYYSVYICICYKHIVNTYVCAGCRRASVSVHMYTYITNICIHTIACGTYVHATHK
jgi:hypothetical protein